MNLVAIDPGPSSCGYVVVHLVGPRARYVSAGTVASVPEYIEALLLDVQAVAVEEPKGYIFSPERGAQLIETAKVAGGIAWTAKRMHRPVVSFSAQEWRKALCGRANADDELVKDTVQRNVIDFPRRSNVHVRDACGLAVVAAWQLAGALGRRVRSA